MEALLLRFLLFFFSFFFWKSTGLSERLREKLIGVTSRAGTSSEDFLDPVVEGETYSSAVRCCITVCTVVTENPVLKCV